MFFSTISRVIFCEILYFYHTFSAILNIIFALILIKTTNQFIPPDEAPGNLSLIIQKRHLYIYPIEIAVSCTFFILSALCFRKKQQNFRINTILPSDLSGKIMYRRHKAVRYLSKEGLNA